MMLPYIELGNLHDQIQFDKGTLTISVPANLRTKSVDVVRVDW